MNRRLLPRWLTADVAAGGVTLAFGIVFTVAALRIPASTFANSVVQPRHLPIAIGVGLVLCGVALVVKGLLVGRLQDVDRLPVGSDDLPPATPVGDAVGDVADELEPISEPVEKPLHLVVVAALLAGYLVAFEPLGFLVATALFLLVGGSYLEPRRITRNVIYALVLSVAIYLLFEVLLGIVLPPGILDWLL